MAGVIRSAKDLWVLISGTSLLKSKELVGTELEENTEKIKCGGLYYKKPNPASLEKLKSQNVQGTQLEFIQKLSKVLKIDELQCYELFCSYLLYEYRGTQNNLKVVFSSERHLQSMLLEIWNFYYTERLYILLCLKHILCYWQDSSHPYRDLYTGFLETINKGNSLGEKLMEQFEELITVETPNKDSHGQIMTEHLLYQWAALNIKEQSELLQILLLYFKDTAPKTEDILKLFTLFQKHSFGMRQTYRQYLGEGMKGHINLIGYLEALIILETLELEWLLQCETEGIDNYFLFKNTDNFKRLDEIICNFGNHPYQGPIMLAWLLVRQCSGKKCKTKQLGNAALQLDVFDYLTTLLSCSILNGEGVIPNLAHSIIYGLISGLLCHFEINTLGKIQNLCQLATSMLKYSNIADDFWKKGLDNGLGILMKTVMDIFPLEFSLLTNMCSALSKAGENSSRKVIQFFEKLPGYTEYFENNMETVAPRTSTWILLEDKAPYGTDTFIIPKKTEGIMLTNFPNVDRKSYSVVQWMLTVNGWQICLCEIHIKLQEVSLGAGYVKQQSIQCILDISHLINSILESYPSSRFQLIHITNEFFTILERYSLLPYPSIDLLTMCLNVIRNLSISSPEETWQKCLSINFFPYMIEISQNIPKLASGLYTNNSILGQIVAAVECVIGQYSLLLAFLKLFNEIAKSYQKHIEEESVFLGCLVYILQDIFPSFHKWRYVKHGIKEKIGQLCLDIFHKILFIKKNEKEKKLRIQGVCVYSLLHLASSQALLRIVCTGESTVQQAIQAHVSDGIGQELIVLVHYSLSVLNRLLLMKYRYNENKNELTPISPLEHVLFSQTHHYSQPHVALIVAYYAFQHYSPRLATLAVQLLKRFAKEFPMSLLACLGTEAEAICDHYLLRLSSATEDVRLKVAIIEFLTVCISHQPGLIERFINITITIDKSDKEKNLNSCLHSVLEILKDKQEKLVYIPEDLHCAAVEFFHALWTRHQLLAEDKLKKNENFWTLLCDPLFQEHQHSRLIAYIIRTLALEVYNTYTFSDNKLDPNVKSVLEKLVKKSLVKLSKFVHRCLNPLLDSDINHSLNISDVSFISEISPDGYILLKCWKDFLLVATKFFKGELTINKNDQISIMEDILESLRLELSNIVNTRTLVLLAELYLLLLQKWDCDTFPTWKKWLGFLTELIHNVATNMDSLHPHLQLTIVCMANTSLKIVMKNSDNNELINESVSDWISSVCILLKPSVLQAEKAILNVETSQYLQLCVATICLLKDLIEYCQFSNSCLINMQHYMILDILGGLLLIALEQCKGIDIVQTILIFFLSLATNYKAAEIICASGIMQKLCLLLTNTYMINKDGISEVLQVPSKVNLSWLDIYNLVIRLITELLQTLKHSFLQDALNFIGVHVERLYFSLQNVRQFPHSTMIEETLITCKIIYQMSFYQQNWQLYHPISLNLLLKGISESCHATVAYLNRPSLLMYLLEHSKVPSNKQQSVLNMSDIHRYKRLSSIEEVEKPSPQFVKVQMRLLQLLAISLSIMNNISPSLYQVIFDHDLDFGKWTILLPINFSIPSIDQESPMNFGTVMNCINICLRSLIKNDPSSSPEQVHFDKTPQEERHLLLYILEISLSLLLSQAVLCLVHPDIAIHDKQYIRRELGAELSSMTLTMNRYLRKSPLSPASSLVTSSQGHIQTSIFDRPLIKILGPLVDKLFK